MPGQSCRSSISRPPLNLSPGGGRYCTYKPLTPPNFSIKKGPESGRHSPHSDKMDKAVMSAHPLVCSAMSSPRHARCHAIRLQPHEMASNEALCRVLAHFNFSFTFDSSHFQLLAVICSTRKGWYFASGGHPYQLRSLCTAAVSPSYRTHSNRECPFRGWA